MSEPTNGELLGLPEMAGLLGFLAAAAFVIAMLMQQQINAARDEAPTKESLWLQCVKDEGDHSWHKGLGTSLPLYCEAIANFEYREYRERHK